MIGKDLKYVHSIWLISHNVQLITTKHSILQQVFTSP